MLRKILLNKNRMDNNSDDYDEKRVMTEFRTDYTIRLEDTMDRF